ncbi:MAG: dual specificity protein phosphatase family protein [Verrucomicrobia bacterium]|nr:dual specificity protein phosphatase family protein [Verrucomicrobiota bacterium]
MSDINCTSPIRSCPLQQIVETVCSMQNRIVTLFYAVIEQAEQALVDVLVAFNFSKFSQPIATLHIIFWNTIDPTRYPWYEPIIDNKLTLSAIPLKNRGHLEDLCNRQITAVVSAVKDFEFSDGLWSEPVKPEDWKANGVDQLVLATQDLTPPSMEDFADGVNFIDRKITNGEHVLVHCKAGKGRSASIVVAYLLVHGKKHRLHFDSVDAAIAYATSKRSAVGISERQKEAITAYWNSVELIQD